MKNNRLEAILKVFFAYYVKLCPMSLQINRHYILFIYAMSFHAFVPFFSTSNVFLCVPYVSLVASSRSQRRQRKLNF